MPTEGDGQEARMRRLLIGQGYKQPYGTNDTAIRRSLGIKGGCADFVGYDEEHDTWLIVESKGGNLEKAYHQLANTLRGLLLKEPWAAGQIHLAIYISNAQHGQLIGKGIGGYFVREGFLQNQDEAEQLQFTLLQGLRIRIIEDTPDAPNATSSS